MGRVSVLQDKVLEICCTIICLQLILLNCDLKIKMSSFICFTRVLKSTVLKTIISKIKIRVKN